MMTDDPSLWRRESIRPGAMPLEDLPYVLGPGERGNNNDDDDDDDDDDMTMVMIRRRRSSRRSMVEMVTQIMVMIASMIMFTLA
jgi:hypothetical protein